MTKNNGSNSSNKTADNKADGTDKSQTPKPDTSKPDTSNTATPNANRARHSRPEKPTTTLDLKASSAKSSQSKDAKPAAPDAAKKPATEAAKPVFPAASAAKTAHKAEAAAKTDASKPAPTHKKAEQSKSAPVKNTEPTKESSGFGGKLVAGLLGGAIALGGWTGLQQSGILPVSTQQTAKQAAPSTEGLDVLQKQIDEKISALNKRLDDLPAASASVDTSKIDEEIAGVKSQIAGLEEKITNAPAGEVVDIEPLSAQIKDLQTQLTASQTSLQAIRSQFDASQVENKTLMTRLEGLEKSLKDEGPEQKAAKVLAATALQNQVAKGENFASALESYKQITGDETSFADLEPFAESGVPTLTNLQKQFDGVSDSILAALEPKPEEGDMIGQLLSSAKSLIKVKPVEGQSGDAPTAVLGRIQTALNNGNVDAIVKEWQLLPEAGQKAGAKWFDAIKTRQAADGILDKTLHNMMTN